MAEQVRLSGRNTSAMLVIPRPGRSIARIALDAPRFYLNRPLQWWLNSRLVALPDMFRTRTLQVRFARLSGLRVFDRFVRTPFSRIFRLSNVGEVTGPILVLRVLPRFHKSYEILVAELRKRTVSAHYLDGGGASGTALCKAANSHFPFRLI